MDGSEADPTEVYDREDRALDLLVRRVFERPGRSVLPSEGALAAYLSGEADVAQQREVLWALLESPAFREAYLTLVGREEP